MCFLILVLDLVRAEWFSTKGNKIINETGGAVRLTGINWFGFETTEEVFHGLAANSLQNLIKMVADHKFNCWRCPVSASVIHDWMIGNPRKDLKVNYTYNPSLRGLSNFDIFKIFIKEVKKYGHRVFIDIHSIVDNSYRDNLWWNAEHPPEYILSALEWIADYFKDEPAFIGIDVKNEPHGTCDDPTAAHWDGTKNDNNWKYFVETAAARIHAKNPKLLIFVEGIECYKGVEGWWGGQLAAVKDYPIKLGTYQNKLVYSPHDYGPSVNPKQTWLRDNMTYDSLMAEVWEPQWLFIHENSIAPIFIGEWGGHLEKRNNLWMGPFVQLIAKYKLSFTHWCLNPDSGDTGGLLLPDWQTWNEEKYNFIKPVFD
uniref:Putative glycosyl hydrolase family5 n=1 Tax=uncultured symbiotic protist of Mastotermes darwiniensis TaxID=403661 RepID=A4UX04_9EUKA|nr:putative glycosyl hydrolase family5 [uncultured symbiotic protist of Mastotermes darwiniensis]